MTNRPEGWSIILVGHWNRSIFVPEWTIPRFFEESGQPSIEIGFLPMQPVVYQDDQLKMEVTYGPLAFRLKTCDEQSLRRCGAMATRAIDELPQTPIHGIGVNFGFREQAETKHISEMFNQHDENSLQSRRWVIGERKLTRRLSRDELTLNLTMTFGPGRVDFDFNFHSDISQGDSDGALQAVKPDRIIWLRDVAEAVLRETYYAEIEANDASASG